MNQLIQLDHSKQIQDIFSVAGYNTATSETIDHRGRQQRPVQLGRAYNFDGVNDRIDIPITIDWSQNWTISFKYRSNATGVPQTLWAIGAGLFRVQMENFGAVPDEYRLLFSNNDNQENTLNIFSSTNWQTITIVKDGTNWTIYNNGVVATTFTRNYTNSLNTLRLGTESAIGVFANGQMYDFFVWNRALGVSDIESIDRNIIPNNAFLLLRCDEGGGTLAVDSSGNNIDGTILNADLATFHTTLTNGQGADWQNQVGSTPSIRFNGTNSISTIADNSFLRFGTGDFTIAFNFVATTFALNGVFFRSLITKSTGTSANGWDIFLRDSDSSVCFFTNSILLNSGSLFTDTEYHIAITRQGTNLRMFVNGVQAGATVANSQDFNLTEILRIGRNTNATSWFDGWLRNILLTRDAVWTSNFTVPQTWNDYQTILANNQVVLFRPNLAIQGENSLFNYTVTHTNTANHFIPRNESNTGFDAYGSPLFYNGGRVKYNAQLRQSNCLTFDGNNDFVSIPYTSDLGTSDWSVSVYFNTSDFVDYRTIWSDAGNSPSNYDGKELRLFNANSLLSFASYNYGTNAILSATGLSINTWYKCVLIKRGNVYEMWLNDVLVATQTISNAYAVSNEAMNIGRYNIGGTIGGYYNGRMVDFRMYDYGLSQVQARNLPNNPVRWFSMQEGFGARIYSRGVQFNYAMNNFDTSNCWNNRQDVVHSNLIDGYEEYTDGGTGLIRVPLSTTGTSLGYTIAGFTSQGVRSAGTWHNGAETQFRNYLAPELITNDVSNYYFNTGTANSLTFNGINTVVGTNKITGKTSVNNQRSNLRIYKRRN